VSLQQITRYPWDGTVTFRPVGNAPVEFTLALRIPSWCRGHAVALNGARLSGAAGPDGYVHVRRTWSKGDTLALTLPLRAERVHADPRVHADNGKVAIQRGPLVYCLEEADNGAQLSTLRLPPDAPLESVDRADLFGGVVAVTAKALGGGSWMGGLYASDGPPSAGPARQVLFIPYYAWANRTPGEMAVWIRE
jgi:hypothetical protein